MDILSAGQCAVRNGSAFIPDEAVAGDGSTSNADRRICDFYDSAGGWQRGCVFGTGGSNDSASKIVSAVQQFVDKLNSMCWQAMQNEL